MRAVVMREFGPPEVLVGSDAPDPVPGPGATLVEVEVGQRGRRHDRGRYEG